MPFFSILIPMYNASESIKKTIESIKKQKFSDYEIIICDDGSNDESYEIVDTYRQNDNRIKLYRHDKNSSILTTRINLMKKAMGHYVLFIDSDDYYVESAFDELYNILQNKKCDMLRFGYKISHDNQIVTPKETDDIIRDILLLDLKTAIWSNCYSIDLIKKIINNVEDVYCNMAEDAYLCLLATANALNINICDNIIYIYNYGDGISTSIKTLSYEKFIKDMQYVELMINKISKYIKSSKKEYTKYLNENQFKLYISVAAKYVFFDKNKENEKLYMEYLNKDTKYRNLINFINENILPYKKY